MKTALVRCLVALCTFFGSNACAAELASLLHSDSVWELDRTSFSQQSAPFGFEWTSKQRDSARCDHPHLTFLGRKVYEVVARFDADKLKAVTLLVYGRGDAGDMDKTSFEELIRKTIAAVDAHTAKKATASGKDAASAVKAERVFWQTPKTHYTLEYSLTRENKARRQEFRAEFVRLELVPAPERKSLLTATQPRTKSRIDPKSQVKRDVPSGDVLVATVPMVDQGQKGYCAVACAERMLRYYGVDADANEIAQIANSSADGGTSSRAMFEALKKLTSRFRVRVQAVDELDLRDFKKLMADYNRAAKRAKLPLLPEDDFIIDVESIYRAMDTEILKEVKIKNGSALTRFQRNVQSHIDAGTPLLWSVQLGKYPEPGIPQSGGGHMRLIIGYNLKTNEILFSDSWGAGHEVKRMPAVNAFIITTGLTVMEPVG